MDLSDAATIANAFLEKLARDNNHWTPQEVLDAADEDDDDGSTLILGPGRVEPHPSEPGVLWITWICGVIVDVDRLSIHNRPEQRQRVESAIAALRAAHPELAGIRALVEMESIDGDPGPSWSLTL